jgi:xylulokinase
MDEQGDVVATHSVEYTFRATPDGGAEQDAREWIDACKQSIFAVRDEHGIDLHNIVAICPTGMHRGLVLLDEHGVPLRDAIIWTDIRCSPQVATAEEKYGERIHNITQNKLTVAATFPKMLWLRENIPDILDKTAVFLYPSNYLAYYLTDVILMDRNNASASLMYDMLQHAWSKTLLDILGLKESICPDLADGFDIHGYVTEKAAFETGLKAGTPVFAGVADASAEMYSIGLKDSDSCMIRLGSAGALGFVISKEDLLQRKRNTIIDYNIYADRFLDGNYILTCASAVKWTRDMFWSELDKTSDSFSIMDQEAADVPVGSEGLMFHPFLLGENSPYFNPNIRAMLHGLTMSHRRKNVLRAVYEGISYCYKNIMDKSGVFEQCKTMIVVGGGTKSALWLSILVDVLGKQGVVPKYCDAAYGAALMAGEAKELWNTSDILKRNRKNDRLIDPNSGNTMYYDLFFPKFRKIAEDEILNFGSVQN